jgi:hypothetical protein
VNGMRWLGLGLGLALAVPPVEWAVAQQSQPPNYARIVREGYGLGNAEAEALEAAVAAKPDDLEARTRLLGYYWRGARQQSPVARIAARRRHILWVIEHHPASAVAALRQLTIDPAGHVLADKEGYELAARLWMEKTQRQSGDARVLGNAAAFFVLPDKARAEALLKLAQRAAPHDRQLSWALGSVYAIAILGIDMMNENFFPLSHNPDQAKGDFARYARTHLETLSDADVVGATGVFLSTRGPMLEEMLRGSAFAVDYGPLAESLLRRARELDPANPANPLFAHSLMLLRKRRGKL